MRNFANPLILLIFSAILLHSCTSDTTVFEEYQKFETLSWNRFDLLKYSMQLEDTESSYDIYINVRHLPEVPYERMTINFTLFTPSGDMRTTDYTLEYYDNEGNPLSECLGDYCDLLVPLRKSFRFYEPGEVNFEIENKYTKIEMPGILEVGLLVKKARSE